MSQIAANTAGVVYDGSSYSSSTSSFNSSYPGLLGTKTDNGAPKAYLNWLIFDRNDVSLTGGFKQITTAGKEAGSDVAHELVTSPTITITDAGYVYIWLSNENATPVEVYFDNLKVTQTKSPVVATNDYYAFGLTFNSYSRENSTKQDYLYNGKELQDELSLGWLEYGARMYQPEIGRWFSIDLKAEEYDAWSPFHYVHNNPVKLLDPDGQEIINGAKQGTKEYDAIASAVSILKETNPKAYNTLQNSSICYNINFGQLNSDNQDGTTKKNGETLVTYSVKKDLSAKNIKKDKDGEVQGAEFERQLTQEEQETIRSEGGDPIGLMKTISAEEAGQFVSIKEDVQIILDVGLLKDTMKELTSILGHEFGHAEFATENTALAFLWSLIGSSDNSGHDKNNPSGQKAKEEEDKARSGYNSANKKIKKKE